MNLPAPNLDGRWQLVRAETGGEFAPDLFVENTVMELVEGTYRIHFAGEVVDGGTFEIGGVVEDRTLLLRGKQGNNAGRTIPCLWQLRGGVLRVCFGMDGVAPTEFATSTSDQRYLATYRRLEVPA